MRRDQRPRTGQRRDGGVRVIRSDEVRFPGHEHPLIERRTSDRDEYADWRARGRRLTPARDAGLAVEGRLARQQRREARDRQRNLTIVALTTAAVLLSLAGWRYASDRKAAATPLYGSGSASAAPISAAHSGNKASEIFSNARSVRPSEPTPVFASYRDLQLRLPVPVDRLTEIGFHQASYTYALHMVTKMPDAKLADANNKRGTGRDISQQPKGKDAYLIGSVLRMWRPRPGKPDSAADVGAHPGTTVFAPVSGTVVKIKSYKLYGKWPDFEIHIRPDGYDKIDLVMIHVTDLSIAEGDHVDAGLTPIAHVRKLSDKVNDQLRDYVVGGGGDHVHIQLNNANDPTYKGLQGAIELEGDSTPATATP